MSNSYIIPPRLRQSDYAKGVITQDEYLKVAAANDANIASARKAVKFGQVEQLTPIQAATPDELLADISKQESDARNNLQKLGFRSQETMGILADLMNEPDVLRMFNINFPAIESDVKRRFNPKLITPTFFLQYLREYAENINATRGLDVNSSSLIRRPINALINNIDELKQLMPDPKVIDYIRKAAKENRAVTKQTVDKLDDLKNVLLTQQQFNNLGQVQEGTVQFNLIQDILDTLKNIPTREETNELAKRVSEGLSLDLINEINSLAASVPSRTDIEDLVKKYRESGVPTATAAQAEATPSKPVKAIPVVQSMDDWNKLNAENKKRFIQSIGADKSLVSKNDPTLRYTISELKSKSDWSVTNADEIVANWLSQKPSAIETLIVPQPQQEQVGRGFKSSSLKKIKLGKGITVQEQPTYRQFGKYAIHMPQLQDQDILNVKYKSLGGLPSFKPMPVSDVFRNFIIDILDGNKPSNYEYQQIDPKERKVFEKIAVGAGIWNSLKLKKTITDDEEDDLNRFEVLRGIYEAGNNNPQVLKELRKLVTKFINNGRIKKNVGFDLLMELSTV